MISTTIRNMFDYGIFALGNQNGKQNGTEASLNPILKGDPRNHNYKIRDKILYPSFRLRQRLKKSQAYTPKISKASLISAVAGDFL